MAEAVALSYETYKAQMKDIAEKSVHIGVGGFASVDEDDFMALVKARKLPILVLEPVSYRHSDSKSEHIVEYMRCAFSVYLPSKPGKYDLNDAAIEQCRMIGRKVITRIRKNTYGRVPADELPKFRHFLAGSVTGQPTQLVADGRVGFYFEFEIFYQVSLAYNDDDWTD